MAEQSRDSAANGRFLVAFAATSLVWFVSLCIAFAVGRFVPERVSLENDPEILKMQQELRDKGAWTEQDLNRAQRLIESKARALTKADSPAELILRLQTRALPVSWIPWALLPLFALKQFRHMWAVVYGLLILMLLGWLSVPVAGVYLGVTSLTFAAKRYAVIRVGNRCALTARSTGRAGS